MLELKNLIIMKTNTILKTFLILIIGTAVTFTSCKKDKVVPEPEIPPVVVTDVKIEAGGGHSYILKPDGTLYGVGYNDYGQLGTGNTTNANNWVKITDNVKAVSAGYQYSLILKKDNTVWATGINGSAQLGDGTKVNQSKLIQVASGAVKIYASLHTSFIIKADNTLWGSGWNYFGMLGVNNESAESLSFTQIDTDVKSVANGTNHTLFLKTDNSVWVAGANNSGQLGNAALAAGTYIKVKIADNVKDIAAGRLHSLVLKNDNTLWGAGFNSHGQLANAVAPGEVARNLTQITTDVKSIQIAANGLNSYIIKNDNSLWGCGWNAYGQLGNGTDTDQTAFYKISDNVADFSAGYAHLLFLKTDKTIWASGADDIGQIGNGTTGAHQKTLVKVIIP